MKRNFSKIVNLSKLLFFILFMGVNSAFSQANKVSLNSENAQIKDWLMDLYEPGVTVADDSIFINAESLRLMNDEAYQKLVYPKTYTWPAALQLIEKQELKKAFWYLINLYEINEKNKDLVVKTVITYDKLFKMDKILVSTFYTYSLIDPEIGTIKNGHSEVTAPHILEKKLQSLKEILFYLDKFKTENEKK